MSLLFDAKEQVLLFNVPQHGVCEHARPRVAGPGGSVFGSVVKLTPGLTVKSGLKTVKPGNIDRAFQEISRTE